MSKRVSPAERLRVQIDEVFAGGQDLARAIEEVARLGAQPLGRRYPLRHGRRLLPQIFQIFEGTYVRTYLHRR